MQCSAVVLEKEIQKFCEKHNKDEGQLWQEINAKYLKEHDRDIMWEKQQDEKSKNITIEMAQAFAERSLVHCVIDILKEYEEEKKQ